MVKDNFKLNRYLINHIVRDNIQKHEESSDLTDKKTNLYLQFAFNSSEKKTITYQVVPALRAIRHNGNACHHGLKVQESGFWAFPKTWCKTMSVQDDENTCREGSKDWSWIGMALNGAGKKSNNRASSDLSPSVGSTDNSTGTTKTNQYKPNPGATHEAALNNGHWSLSTNFYRGSEAKFRGNSRRHHRPNTVNSAYQDIRTPLVALRLLNDKPSTASDPHTKPHWKARYANHWDRPNKRWLPCQCASS